MRTIMKRYLLAAACLLLTVTARAQQPGFKWNVLPVKGLLLSVPAPQDVPLLCRFIKEALKAEGVNTLALRIEYAYQFKSHPELAEHNAISENDLKQIVEACRESGIRFIPTLNLLAHQSEQTEMGPLLKHYPQLDESPDYNPPVPWKNGGMFDFYSKCVCPQHPDLFPIIFSLMDELIDVCGADAFHVGLDEAWIIGYDKCPRCGGRDKAELFGAYVTALHQHLKEKKCQLWMWSDRLIDGKTTNLLAWQASMNNTARAIDMIPKDIMICDWKYEDAPPTPGYFAVKGFHVLPAACGNKDVALAQLEQVYAARKNALRAEFSRTLSERMPGVFETMWVNTREFIDGYYNRKGVRPATQDNVDTFKALFAEIRKKEKQ
ncbi:family 20 glycosylhydrolase [Chitinophaga eiseniae]|uniref:Family 20 glycosylhydrolase n=1 Tax=Chitinophaga eiseniae TaxID=634771 RepID=A0A847SSL5_9BACT|nr:family 20 glycosylhydrolase [Chitinophaga eiseniae]NLR80576.1 family 20 glycosylhydrolase [Chitinophaga eiseniae]